MTRKLIQGTVFSFLIIIVPAFGNHKALFAPHLWIMLTVGILANLFQPSYKPFEKSAPSEDKNTALQILWTCCLTQLFAVLEAVYLRYPQSFGWNAITSLALILIFSGLALRTWAVWTLGRFFTWHIKVESHQKVIRSGPYKFVRHPSYTGALLTYFFGPILFQAWYTALIAAIFLPLAFYRRIRLEENLLKSKIGKEYLDYSQQVKALIPGIW